jgi:hypothetical protein
MNLYPDDDAAARAAEADGIALIYGIANVPDGMYIDTPENRAVIAQALKAQERGESAADKPPFERLVDKLGAELGEYHAELLTRSKEYIIGEAYIAASMSDAFFSLTEELELTDAQITALLEAESPLQDVAEALRDSHNQNMCMLDADTILEAAHIEVPDEPGEPTEPVSQPRTVREWIERGREEMKNRQPSPKPEHKKRDAEL